MENLCRTVDEVYLSKKESFSEVSSRMALILSASIKPRRSFSPLPCGVDIFVQLQVKVQCRMESTLANNGESCNGRNGGSNRTYNLYY